MEYKDYYKIMGLESSANQDDVKRAYRKLARKFHPDVSKEADAEQKFKELGEAYEVLKDPDKRKKYDQYGQYWKQQEQGQQQGSNYQRQHFDENTAADFEDFINSIFKQRKEQEYYEPFHHKGQDIHAQLAVTLEDSYHGTEKSLQLQVPSIDKQGRMSYTKRSIKVKIPKGITDKKQIRLKGQGGIAGEQAGDLYIEIHIQPHSIYKLNNKNILLELPVSPWEAALGATVQVPTLGGALKVKIPKQSQTGKKMRLKAKGLAGSPPGDQIITLKIINPGNMNEELNKLYESMAKASSFNPRAELGVK